jgi:sugar lactone lactonase YvrE
MTTHDPAPSWSDRLELGEGARWVNDRLILVDILTGRLLRATEADSLCTLIQLPVPLGAVAPVAGAPDTWVAAAGTGICLLDPSGEITWLSRPEHSAPAKMRMNDGVADPSGRFWAGSMAYDATASAGSLYRVDGDGTTTRILTGITVPNGPAFTADGRTMYLADSAVGVVHRYLLDPSTGQLSRPEPFVAVQDGRGSPDGMTVDSEGGVWIAMWGAGAIHRYLPDGHLDRVVALPAVQPTSVCLGGTDGRTLYVTTAAYGRNPADSVDGAVFTMRVDVPGPPAAFFRPSW